MQIFFLNVQLLFCFRTITTEKHAVSYNKCTINIKEYGILEVKQVGTSLSDCLLRVFRLKRHRECRGGAPGWLLARISWCFSGKYLNVATVEKAKQNCAEKNCHRDDIVDLL